MAMLRVLRLDLGSTLARPWLDLGLKASPGRGQRIGSNGNASRFAHRPWLDLGSTLARPWLDLGLKAKPLKAKPLKTNQPRDEVNG